MVPKHQPDYNPINYRYITYKPQLLDHKYHCFQYQPVIICAESHGSWGFPNVTMPSALGRLLGLQKWEADHLMAIYPAW